MGGVGCAPRMGPPGRTRTGYSGSPGFTSQGPGPGRGPYSIEYGSGRAGPGQYSIRPGPGSRDIDGRGPGKNQSPGPRTHLLYIDVIQLYNSYINVI